MALETATYISGLVASNPPGTDPKSQADEHFRLIKSTILNTFPNITGAVTATHTELNYVDGVTSSIQAQLDSKLTTVPLNTITAATGASTISNGANDQIWNWTLTAASDVGLTIGEAAASTSGAGSQYLLSVGTLAASTANPFGVTCRGTKVIDVTSVGSLNFTGVTPIISGNGAGFSFAGGSALTSGNGGNFNSTCGNGAGAGGGGGVSLAGGVGGSTGPGGNATLRAGNGGAGSGAGGTVAITAGNATSGAGGDITLTTGTGTTSGKVNFVNTNVANGTVACVLTASSGPTGASTAVQGWLAIKVGGTSRYVPYW